MAHAPFALEVIEIKDPCPADWDAMQPDGSRRFCSHCNKFVHDLSAMTHAQAEQLICASAGELCARFQRDTAGVIVTLDYHPSPKRKSWKFWTGLGLMLAFISGVAQATFLKRAPAPAAVPAIQGKVLVPLMGSIAPANCYPRSPATRPTQI